MRNRGGEGQWPVHILTIIDGFSNKMFSSVKPSTILLVQVTRQCTTLPI